MTVRTIVKSRFDNKSIKDIVRSALLLVCWALVGATTHAYDFPRSYTEKFEGRTLVPVEGLWLWNSGAIVEIKANSTGAITLTLLDTPDPDIDTPVVIGTGTFAGKENTYDVQLVTKGNLIDRKANRGKADFVLTINNNRRLSLSPYSTSLKVNLWRLVPYLFRFSVRHDAKPDRLDGAIRLWPLQGSPENPIVL